MTRVGLWPAKGQQRSGVRILPGASRFAAALTFVALAALGGCATPPTDPDALAAFKEANDPLEPMNRYFFEVNYAADELLFKPLAGWYYVALPNFAQDGIRNALRNLRTPVILANDLFQGETDRAGTTFGRFLVNSTLGVGGLFDIASRMGMEFHDEDFGQTLAVHGVGEGPYLMLPLFGPSNPRDLAGTVVDTFLNPLTYVGIFTDVKNVGLATTGLSLLDERARNLKTLDQIRKGSLDYYATIRSLYRQRRQDEIHNGAPPSEGTGTGETSAAPAAPTLSFLASKEPIETAPTADPR
ncbi:MAG TPA: VacJ family lipoprotein [Methylomirabilota bacterium]|nr:VacJ family lipoprotein [Methylomirabilota bacterium]